jgi:hypothetical protein
MIERIQRMKDVVCCSMFNINLWLRTACHALSLGKFGSFQIGITLDDSHPSDFFRRIEEQSPNLLEWRGELYFELHRGTYTSQARNKVANFVNNAHRYSCTTDV